MTLVFLLIFVVLLELLIFFVALFLRQSSLTDSAAQFPSNSMDECIS